jgi:predicted tellurium resistance membrane protein TerC
MLMASKPLTQFVNSHPTIVILCLSFLLMIGFSLVTEGLKAGDRVVISGLQKVRPGVQVKAQEVTADNNQQAASGAQPEQSKS